MHTDRDECALGISGCNQICTNTVGSYMCSCNPGYQIALNNRTCTGKHIASNMMVSFKQFTMQYVDMNECALGMHDCNQICTNTNGSYTCSCSPGYKISSNNRTCVGKPLIEIN